MEETEFDPLAAMDLVNEIADQPPPDPEPSPLSDLAPEVAPLAVVRMQNRVIERARQSSEFPTERLPSSEIACATCSLGTWVRTGDTLKAHCSKMFLVTWTSDEPTDLTDCSAREEALLQLE